VLEDRSDKRAESRVNTMGNAKAHAAHGRTEDSGDTEEEEQTLKGMLSCGATRVEVTGRALRLMLWMAARQERINAVAAASGQLWLTWKGEGLQSVEGEVKTRLT
jgi:hypothetical protein